MQMVFALYSSKDNLEATATGLSPAANRVWSSWEVTNNQDATEGDELWECDGRPVDA